VSACFYPLIANAQDGDACPQILLRADVQAWASKMVREIKNPKYNLTTESSMRQYFVNRMNRDFPGIDSKIILKGLSGLYVGSDGKYRVDRDRLTNCFPQYKNLLLTAKEPAGFGNTPEDASKKLYEIWGPKKGPASTFEYTAETKELAEIYRSYLVIKDCYEARKDFATQFITVSQKEQARNIAKVKETAWVKEHPTQKDILEKIWDDVDKTKNGAIYSFLPHVNDSRELYRNAEILCRGSLQELLQTNSDLQNTKKDF
jgi:hypothetical protein